MKSDRRRKTEEEHENHERWLVSYADFITLLFAFFVVMYSISSVNEGKYRVLSDSLGAAFTGGVGVQVATQLTSSVALSGGVISQPKPLAQQADRQKLTHIAGNLRRLLAPLVKDGRVRVTQSSLGVSVEINASVLFTPGEAVLSERSKSVLSALAAALSDDSHRIQVEGHTDNLPIANARFASNWDLSAVRASSVARLFTAEGISEERLTVIGHAANQPVVDSSTEEGRARNRRVTVLILPQTTLQSVEVPVSD